MQSWSWVQHDQQPPANTISVLTHSFLHLSRRCYTLHNCHRLLTPHTRAIPFCYTRGDIVIICVIWRGVQEGSPQGTKKEYHHIHIMAAGNGYARRVATASAGRLLFCQMFHVMASVGRAGYDESTEHGLYGVCMCQ